MSKTFFIMMKPLFIFMLLFSIEMVHADEAPAGCPTDDANLQAAVNNGQKIACTIDFFTGGHGGQWVTKPTEPNAKDTIAEACIDAQQTGCENNIYCMESPYFNCVAQ